MSVLSVAFLFSNREVKTMLTVPLLLSSPALE